VNGDERPLSDKSVRNAWVALSAFFSWAKTEFNLPDPMDSVPAPRFKEAPFEPLSKDEVEVLLKACDFSQEANTTERRRFTMRRPTAKRDRAIILTLVDISLRASELCALNVGDVDLKTGRVEVKHGPSGGAKLEKGQAVHLGKAARRAVWQHERRFLAVHDPSYA
jgi:integrase